MVEFGYLSQQIGQCGDVFPIERGLFDVEECNRKVRLMIGRSFRLHMAHPKRQPSRRKRKGEKPGVERDARHAQEADEAVLETCGMVEKTLIHAVLFGN